MNSDGGHLSSNPNGHFKFSLHSCIVRERTRDNFTMGWTSLVLSQFNVVLSYLKQFIFDFISAHVQKIFHTIQPIYTFVLVWSWCTFLFGLLCIKWNLQHIKVIRKVRWLGARTANFSIICYQMRNWEWKFYKME
jgi:hypothetical protein